MKTICWVQHASEGPLFRGLARALELRGYKSVFVCKTQEAHDAYVREGFISHFPSATLFDGAEKVTCSEYDRIQREYGAPGVQSAADSDVHMEALFPGQRMRQLEVVAKSFMYWENFFDTESVDYVIGRETATFLTRTAYQVSKKREIPFSQIMYGPASGHCLLCDVDELHIWSELDLLVTEGQYSLSEEQVRKVEAFVAERLPDPAKEMALRFVPPSLRETVRRYVGLVLHDTERVVRENPVHAAALRYGRMRLTQQMEWKYLTQNLFPYDEVREEESFVYFPVYSGLETSYLTQTPYWARNEVELIREVARKLPIGTWLYVKEHPHNPGDLSYAQLRALKCIPNVRVVRPEVASQYLINASRLVVTIQGTAGWEAFLSKRPVVCIDSVAFYARSKLVYVVENISCLEEIITRALADGEKSYHTYIDAWRWFIHAVITTMGTGSIVNLEPPYGFVTDKVSVERLAEYVDTTYRRRRALSLEEKKNK